MKVLHLVKTGVGATWALRQMRELVDLGVDIHVAMPPGGPREPAYRDAGVQVHHEQLDFPVRRPWRWPALAARTRALVERIEPDVVHSHFVGTTLTMRLALGARPRPLRVFQVPGPLHLEHALFRRAEIASARTADYWIGSCRLTCDVYRRCGIAAERVALSYYGTDVDSFDARPSGRLRRELGLAPEDALVGMIAFMYAPKRYLGQRRGLKGHEDFIDALQEVARAMPAVRGVAVGGAWGGAAAYEERVRRYGRQRCPDRLTFLGTRTDVAEIYPELTLAVHPSHSENVGGAIESLLANVPTIATEVGGFPDLVRDGDTGWLVPPRDPRALAAAILDALRHPDEAERRARRGRELARDLFNVRQSARQVLSIYRQFEEHARSD